MIHSLKKKIAVLIVLLALTGGLCFALLISYWSEQVKTENQSKTEQDSLNLSIRLLERERKEIEGEIGVFLLSAGHLAAAGIESTGAGKEKVISQLMKALMASERHYLYLRLQDDRGLDQTRVSAASAITYRPLSEAFVLNQGAAAQGLILKQIPGQTSPGEGVMLFYMKIGSEGKNSCWLSGAFERSGLYQAIELLNRTYSPDAFSIQALLRSEPPESPNNRGTAGDKPSPSLTGTAASFRCSDQPGMFSICVHATPQHDSSTSLTNPIIKKGIALALTVSGICMILALVVLEFFFRPFSKIIDYLRRIPRGGIAEDLDLGVEGEFAELALVINGMNRELREQKQSMQRHARALERTSKLHRLKLDSLSDGVLTIDRQGIIQSVNQTVLKLFGYARSDLLGQSIALLLPERTSHRHQGYIENYRQTGYSPIFGQRDRQLQMRKRDGVLVPVDLIVTPFKFDGDEQFIGTIRDQSERNRLQKLAERQRRFADLLRDNIPHIVWLKEQENLTFVDVNPESERVFGMTRSEVIGKSYRDIFPQAYAQPLAESERQILNGEKKPLPITHLMPTQSGSRLYRTIAVPITINSDENYLLGISQDIQEEEDLKRELYAEQQRSRIYLDIASTAIVEYDARGLISSVNRVVAEESLFSIDEIIGKHYSYFLKQEEVVKRFDDAYQAHEPQEFEFNRAVNKILYSWKVRSTVDRGGQVLGLIAVGINITELAAKKEAAEHANALKNKFLANMSHELRTPLNAVIGYSEMLSEIALEEKREREREDLDRIAHSGKQLLHLVNEILDLAKVDAGKMELHQELIALESLMKEVELLVEPMMAENQNAFTISGEGEPELVTDYQKLKQILLNLLSNAAKFTHRGHISLAYEVSADRAVFRIEDTGIGIERKNLDSIFQEFVQADGSTTRAYGGTGLGLALCRKFSKLIGGEISVESQLGAGTVFTVTLQIQELQEKKYAGRSSVG